jgi:hypothetical protein
MKKTWLFLKENEAQAMVEYVLVVTVLIFGTLAVVEGIELPFEIDGDVVKLAGFKDAINTYLKQIYNLLHIMIP